MMTTPTLDRLNLLSLPCVNLISSDGWQAVTQLPSSPGVYVCVCTLAKRHSLKTSDPNKAASLQATALEFLGQAELHQIAEITERGNQAAAILYIGMSKDLRKRWVGHGKGLRDTDNRQAQHHKKMDLKVASYLLNTLFDVTSLRLHYLLSTDSKGENSKARYIESELIKLHRPLLNGREPIVGNLVEVSASGGRGAIASKNYRLKAVREARGYRERQAEFMAKACK